MMPLQPSPGGSRLARVSALSLDASCILNRSFCSTNRTRHSFGTCLPAAAHRKRRQFRKDRHGLALKRRTPGKVAGQCRDEGFRPFDTCTSHSRRPPRLLLAPVPCRAGTPAASHGCSAGSRSLLPGQRHPRPLPVRSHAGVRPFKSLLAFLLRPVSLHGFRNKRRRDPRRTVPSLPSLRRANSILAARRRPCGIGQSGADQATQC